MEKSKINDQIVIRGAREHNLKNVDVAIPKNALVVVTGPSGSGKSSLVLDILYTEGKRRYMESLSSYARQFLGIPKKPEVDSITGLCPAIAIEQKTVGSNPRSTVGTITELYDYLRILYARIGHVHCPNCKKSVKEESPETISVIITECFDGKDIIIAAPIADRKKGEFVKELLGLFESGFYRFRINGDDYKFSSADEIRKLDLKKRKSHTIDLLIDALTVSKQELSRICQAVEQSFNLANGECRIIVDGSSHRYSMQRMCVACKESIPDLEPRLFSFNSPIGSCDMCEGIGTMSGWKFLNNRDDDDQEQHFASPLFTPRMVTCSACNGKRLNKYALAVTVSGKTIYDLSNYSLSRLYDFFSRLTLEKTEQHIVVELVKEIRDRLTFLNNVGLSYLTLNRSARTLSGGEGQRIRLATQIGSTLSGVLYVLDEPSIGLHQRDNDRLINTLKALRDQGNTVVVVEHDIDTMRHADHIIDMGPAAGVLGGRVTAVGEPKSIKENKQSLSGAYLSGRDQIAIPTTRRKPNRFLQLSHLSKNNLKNIDVALPLGLLCGISGVSGSGKSTLVMEELVPAVKQQLLCKVPLRQQRKSNIQGAERLRYCVVIDQSPIGRTPRSNPATYLGIFNGIRTLFASLPESNARGYKPGRFSFNVADGRCQECRGDGSITVEMHFLPPVTVLCKVCKGKRYNAETLRVRFKGKSIADILAMTAYEALEVFKHHPPIAKRLQLLCDVGLDYLQLGQSSKTLSGGEAQRIKLVDELAKRGNDTLYVLDEPTTGLHSSDIKRLLQVLNILVDKGNSMIIIEHNLDVLKTVDHIIDLGPEGGDQGGTIVATGTPQEVAQNRASITGRYLKENF